MTIQNNGEFRQAVEQLFHLDDVAASTSGKRGAEELTEQDTLSKRITDYIARVGLGVVSSTIQELYPNADAARAAQEALFTHMFRVIEDMDTDSLTSLLKVQNETSGLTLLHNPLYFEWLEPLLEMHGLDANQFPSRSGVIADSEFIHAMNKLTRNSGDAMRVYLVKLLEVLPPEDRLHFMLDFIDLSTKLNATELAQSINLMSHLKNYKELKMDAECVKSAYRLSIFLNLDLLKTIPLKDVAEFPAKVDLFIKGLSESDLTTLVSCGELYKNIIPAVLRAEENPDRYLKTLGQFFDIFCVEYPIKEGEHEKVKEQFIRAGESIRKFVEPATNFCESITNFIFSFPTRNKYEKNFRIMTLLAPLIDTLPLENPNKRIIFNDLRIRMHQWSDLKHCEEIIRRAMELIPHLNTTEPPQIVAAVEFLGTGKYTWNTPQETKDRIQNALYALAKSKRE